MAIAGGFVATAIFASIAVSAASTASADPPTMSGHYTATETSPTGSQWTFGWYLTTCGDGCVSVASTPGGQADGQARLANGQWTMDRPGLPANCADGTSVPNASSQHITWDANTLAGTEQMTNTVAACGEPAGYQLSNHLQLAKAD
jgi:hypothetical protein